MDIFTEGRGAAAFLFTLAVLSHWQRASTNDEEMTTVGPMEDDCGLRYVQLIKGQSMTKEAKQETWQGGEECKTVYKSLDSTINLYLIFKKFEMKDCGVRLETFWGEGVGKMNFTCKKVPEINKVYFQEGEHNMSMTMTKGQGAKETFEIQYEVTTNATIISLSSYHSVSPHILTTPILLVSLLVSLWVH